MARVHEEWVDELLAPIGAAGLETIRTRLARLTDAQDARREAKEPAE